MSTVTESNAVDELCINAIRVLSMDAVQQANAGHPGTPMALAPLAYTLFTRVMKHDPHDPHWPNRDRFILSAGHASMLLYSTLYLSGYDLGLTEIERFRQLGSRTPGHPEYGETPGVEMTTGPLGQGISHAVGFALAERLLAAKFNIEKHEIVDHYTYVIASDGDLEEGISSEAGSLAGHLGLGKLIAFYDENHISIEGDTKISFTEDVATRYSAYGWHVQNLGENISVSALEEALENAQKIGDRPSLIIVRTHIAPGAPTKQDTAGAHGSPLGEDEILATKRVYHYPSEEPFFVPEEALAHFREAVDRGGEAHREWQTLFHEYKELFPGPGAEFERIIRRKLPEDWDATLPSFGDIGKGVATRKSSQQVLQWAAAHVPELVGGSADLAPSTLTLIDGGGNVDTGRFEGRNLHFGIREHAMGAIVNGLTLSGLRGYGATFFTFSDYMKGSIRLAALMKIPSIFVLTHDSIGVGEDGPTHQPIEQLAHLRATPNLAVLRPADANETALAWHFAIASEHTPTALVLSRQNLPTLDPKKIPADAIERGAYVLLDAQAGPGESHAILIATGSEVAIALEAAELLKEEKIAARVVSMPSMENFAAQDEEYRKQVLPPAIRARVSVEAAATFGWHRWVGELGETVGMESFGASGKAEALYEHFGITAQAVAEAAKRSVQRAK